MADCGFEWNVMDGWDDDRQCNEGSTFQIHVLLSARPRLVPVGAIHSHRFPPHSDAVRFRRLQT